VKNAVVKYHKFKLFPNATNVKTSHLVGGKKVQFSSVQARNRPSGLRAFAEVLLEPSGRDLWLGTAGTLEAAKITSLSDE